MVSMRSEDSQRTMLRTNAASGTPNNDCLAVIADVAKEMWLSTDLLFQSKLTWLLLLGPLALFGDATGIFGEALCFFCSGVALIPCAERLSFVTEQVAQHTNGTIGALLNATFGNAPELLISTAALRAGFYRVVQLAMLGSMLTNLLFVFGMSCFLGGMRWQVQELRITSGNVSVGMLLVATAGSLLPAALALSGEMRSDHDEDEHEGVPSYSELAFCRINAVVMMLMYLCYLLFQLGTHKEEFDEEENIVETPDHLLLMTPHYTSRHGRRDKKRAKRNLFCLRYFRGGGVSVPSSSSHELLSTRGSGDSQHQQQTPHPAANSSAIEMTRTARRRNNRAGSADGSSMDGDDSSDISSLNSSSLNGDEHSWTGSRSVPTPHKRKATPILSNGGASSDSLELNRCKSHSSDDNGLVAEDAPFLADESGSSNIHNLISADPEPVMSLRVGIIWLFIITLCISAMSDILVDTIDGFAYRCHLSEVFTSMVIVPFFSNVAEQVSAVIFAYRNEMDLCVGVTVGSAIQIATFVLPGCVLIGMAVDRSMTLYFRGYETACLFLSVFCVAAVLQGGTTNWLVGLTLIGIYTMIAAGFWFHEYEDLSIDAEIAIQNQTRAMASTSTALGNY